MIIELNVPYSEKDKAKSLGAKWNPERKLWYLLNPVRIDPFLRWVPGADHLPKNLNLNLDDCVKQNRLSQKRNQKNRKARRREARREGINKYGNPQKIISGEVYSATGPEQIESCGCNVLPWEHCEHISSTFTSLA